MAEYEYLELGNKFFFIGAYNIEKLSIYNLTYSQNYNISIFYA